MKSTGAYLRELREQKCVPIREVASALNLDQSTWSKFERDERIPKGEIIFSIADYFQIDFRYLTARLKAEHIAKTLSVAPNADQIMDMVQKRLAYIRAEKYVQSKIDL